MDLQLIQERADHAFEKNPDRLVFSQFFMDGAGRMIEYHEWRFPTSKTIDRHFGFNYKGHKIEVAVSDRRGANGVTLEEAYLIYVAARDKIENGQIYSPYTVSFVENLIIVHYEVDNER